MARTYAPLCVNKNLVKGLRDIQTETVRGEDARRALGTLLQSALRLEFATIPPYLSAAYSLRDDNEEIYLLIARVAKEEMLHMTVVANVMNAIGVSPDIVAAVPEYPHELTVFDPPLRLDLRSFSLELVEQLFMQIETPEDPVDFEPEPEAAVALSEPRETIGQFYQEIIDLIEGETIPNLFQNAERDAYKQIDVTPNFRRFAYTDNDDSQRYPLNDNIDFIIKDKASAVKHLTWVVDQGEGTSPLNPLTAEGIPSHYHRFESILEGQYLVKDVSVPDLGHSFSGADLAFNPAGVHEFDDNAKPGGYADSPDIREEMEFFNSIYTELIDLLQTAFNCPSPDQEPEARAAYRKSISRMNELSRIAGYIVQRAAAGNKKAGIPFQYNPIG